LESSKRRVRAKLALALLFNLSFPLALLALAEGVLLLAVRVPWLPAPGRLLEPERQAYLDHRHTIQYDRDCARYDDELAYTLRPGDCTFSNDEFSVRVHVNRLGLRDDEASLQAPEVVVLGDSFAMGWGVEQDEAFPQLLEARTGLRVLNAGVASYGTAREVLTLGRIDLSRLHLLVIQYCGANDVPENRVFVENGGRLPVMTRETYDAIADAYQTGGAYWFGSYLYRLVKDRVSPEPPLARQLAQRMGANADNYLVQFSRVDARSEARLFLDVLARAPVDLSGVPIVVLELEGWGRLDDEFLDALDAELSAGAAPRPGAKLRTLRLSHRLDARRHYFRLDDHMNAAGHREVADALVALLPELGIRAGSAP